MADDRAVHGRVDRDPAGDQLVDLDVLSEEGLLGHESSPTPAIGAALADAVGANAT